MSTGTFTPLSSRRLLIQASSATGGAMPLAVLAASATFVACASLPGLGVSIPAGSFVERTTSAPTFIAREQDVAFSATSVLGEVRRRTSFTWDQIAKIVRVSRRAVHAWAGGAAMKPEHQEALQSLLERVRQFRDTHPFAVRRMILQEHGLVEPDVARVPAGNEPAIMLADYRDTSSPIVVKRASEARTRVIRR